MTLWCTRYSNNVNVQHSCLLQDTIQQCCLLFAALLAGCHANRPFQRVLKNIVRSSEVRYAPLLTLYNAFLY